MTVYTKSLALHKAKFRQKEKASTSQVHISSIASQTTLKIIEVGITKQLSSKELRSKKASELLNSLALILRSLTSDD
ncbi:MAG: hypothetical protein ACK5NC_06665 [Vibrio sp.]